MAFQPAESSKLKCVTYSVCPYDLINWSLPRKMDEPNNALDPHSTVIVRGLISNMGRSGKTVIMTTHNLDEVERTCTQFQNVPSIFSNQSNDSRPRINGTQIHPGSYPARSPKKLEFTSVPRKGSLQSLEVIKVNIIVVG